MRLRPAPVPAAQLSYNAGLRQYVGEISSTHGFGRVWDDACDQGLTLIGRTGTEIVFVVIEAHRSADGDTTDWLLRPAAPVEPRLADLTLVLFND